MLQVMKSYDWMLRATLPDDTAVVHTNDVIQNGKLKPSSRKAKQEPPVCVIKSKADSPRIPHSPHTYHLHSALVRRAVPFLLVDSHDTRGDEDLFPVFHSSSIITQMR